MQSTYLNGRAAQAQMLLLRASGRCLTNRAKLRHMLTLESWSDDHSLRFPGLKYVTNRKFRGRRSRPFTASKQVFDFWCLHQGRLSSRQGVYYRQQMRKLPLRSLWITWTQSLLFWGISITGGRMLEQ